MTDIVPAADNVPAPINLASVFDLALPLTDRCAAMMDVLAFVAELTVEREADDANTYDDPVFRSQEIKRRTLKGIVNLGEIAHMAELRWAIQNGGERWVDANGAEVTLLEVIESQLPDEEQRASSGRARQVWSFLDTAQAFRDVGIPDQEIARCAKSGLSSALGITAAAQRKLADVTPPPQLRGVYEELIEAAADTTTLDTLRRKVRVMVDPTDEPPPPIPYSVEPDGAHWWLVARPTHDQFTDLVLRRLGDSLEPDKMLPETFARYWRDVPVGRDEEAE